MAPNGKMGNGADEAPDTVQFAAGELRPRDANNPPLAASGSVRGLIARQSEANVSSLYCRTGSRLQRLRPARQLTGLGHTTVGSLNHGSNSAPNAGPTDGVARLSRVGYDADLTGKRTMVGKWLTRHLDYIGSCIDGAADLLRRRIIAASLRCRRRGCRFTIFFNSEGLGSAMSVHVARHLSIRPLSAIC